MENNSPALTANAKSTVMNRLLCCSPNLTAVMGCPWRQAVHRAQLSFSSLCFFF